MTDISIAGRTIGTQHRPFIVAEAGINHNGERERAIAMIHAAKAAGADAVKFQTFKAAEFCGDPNQMFTYRSQGKNVTEPMLTMFQRYELSRDDWFAIRKECDKASIVFLSTPQNRSDLDLLLEIGIPAVKIGSDDFTNLPLLRSYAQTKLPIILSCGMADLGEVCRSLDVVGALDGYPTVLLLCTSQYPTPPQDVNLRKLVTLHAAFPDLTLGFSDHTQGPMASSLAVALGAAVFEKHFTLDHDLPGPDHWFAENPQELKEWVSSILAAKVMLGSARVCPTVAELGNKKEFSRMIVAARDIAAGEIFSESNLSMRRIAGGTGLPAHLFDYLAGRSTSKAYKKNDPIAL